MEIVKNIAAVVGCISACTGLVITIFKPIRKAIINGITNKQRESEVSQKLTRVMQDIGSMKEDIREVKDSVVSLDDRVNKIEKNVLQNESDRLKSELAHYAAMCRRGEPIYEADYIHIQEVYEKYHMILHCNHTGTDNYNTIKEYFEKINAVDR